MDSKKGAGGLLFKVYYPSFPTYHGKKANIIADILMPAAQYQFVSGTCYAH
jgi:hypothetical protein